MPTYKSDYEVTTITAIPVAANATIFDEFLIFNGYQLKIQLKNTGANPLTGVNFYGKMSGVVGAYGGNDYVALNYDHIGTDGLVVLPTLAAGASANFTVELDEYLYFRMILHAAAAPANTTIEISYYLSQKGYMEPKKAFDGSAIVAISGAASTPLPVFMTNELEILKYSTAANDFTATVTNLTYNIVLSVDTLGGVALRDDHFQTAELEVYRPSTHVSTTILLDHFTWVFATKTLNVQGATNAFVFATGDEVYLAIESFPKAYVAATNSNRVSGVETEGAAFSNAMFPMSGRNVANTAAYGGRIDNPANITATTNALDVHAFALGLVGSAGTQGDTDGDLIGKVRGFATLFGLVADAVNPDGTAMARLRTIATWDDGASHAEVVGIETEGVAITNKMIPISGRNVAGALAHGAVVDDPASVIITTPSMAVYDFNVRAILNAWDTAGGASSWARVTGTETEGGAPTGALLPISGLNVAGLASYGFRVDDPANIIVTTNALAVYDFNATAAIGLYDQTIDATYVDHSLGVGGRYEATPVAMSTDMDFKAFQIDIYGNLKIVGTVANHDNVTAAAPLKIAGVYNTAIPTLDNTDVGNLQVDVNSNLQVVGSLAHDAVDAGNPLKVGFKAVSVLPAAVAANDRANAISDLYGRQMIAGHVISSDAIQTLLLQLPPTSYSTNHPFFVGSLVTVTGTVFTTASAYTKMNLQFLLAHSDVSGYGTFTVYTSPDNVNWAELFSWATTAGSIANYTKNYILDCAASYVRVDFTRSSTTVSATAYGQFFRG